MYVISSGTVPTMPKVILVHREGQSNQNGFEVDSSLPSTYLDKRADVKIWNGSTFTPLTKSNNMYPVEDSRYAAEFSFSWKLADATGQPVWLVKHAVGSTSMNSDWKVGATLYNNATTTLQNAISYLNANSIPFDLYIMFNQGENDSGTSLLANAYGALYQAHLTDRFSLFPIKGYICTTTRDDLGGYIYSSIVGAAQRTAMGLRPNSTYVDMNGVDDGLLHYTAAGYEELGLREANALLSLI